MTVSSRGKKKLKLLQKSNLQNDTRRLSACSNRSYRCVDGQGLTVRDQLQYNIRNNGVFDLYRRNNDARPR